MFKRIWLRMQRNLDETRELRQALNREIWRGANRDFAWQMAALIGALVVFFIQYPDALKALFQR